MDSYFVILMLCTGIESKGLNQLMFSQGMVDLICGQCDNVTLHNLDANLTNKTIKLSVEFDDIVTISPKEIKVEDDTNSWLIHICGQEAGFTIILANVTSENYSDIAYLPITVSKIEFLKWLSGIVGWIYFLTWSVSYYPQIYANYIRKSVIGLNFDFVALNIIGFIFYSLYNCGVYFIPFIQEEYFQLHPKGRNPVLFNDVFFSFHAALATSIIVYQCLIYERGNQRVSLMARLILFLYFLVILFCSALVYLNRMSWLEFLLSCSYIKLTVTMIKYVPQALMNYTRKSTEGWSIGSVWLDLIGGIFSILQMLINGYNFNDWDSIVGDPTKFGLGLFSIVFDVIFIIQHYVLYRYNKSEVDDEILSHEGNPICGSGDSETADSNSVWTTTKFLHWSS